MNVCHAMQDVEETTRSFLIALDIADRVASANPKSWWCYPWLEHPPRLIDCNLKQQQQDAEMEAELWTHQ